MRSTARAALGAAMLIFSVMLSFTSAQAVTINWITTLEPSQEVPSLATGASGIAACTIDTATLELDWELSFSGLTSVSTAAHFHNAPFGINGPVLIPIPNASGMTSTATPITGSATLDVSMLSEFLAGNVYINVHDTTFPGGEIRGQVELPALLLNWSATLDGAQEVPAVGTSASGTASGRIDTQTRELGWKLSFSDLTAVATASHFHRAPAGVNGPVIVNIPGVVGVTEAIVTGDSTLGVNDLAAFLAGDVYVNVHDILYPGGEIRGQVVLGQVAPTSPVPEPSTMLLLGSGLLGLAGEARRKRKA